MKFIDHKKKINLNKSSSETHYNKISENQRQIENLKKHQENKNSCNLQGNSHKASHRFLSWNLIGHDVFKLLKEKKLPYKNILPSNPFQKLRRTFLREIKSEEIHRHYPCLTITFKRSSSCWNERILIRKKQVGKWLVF